jgi:hypothetical protein
MPKKYQSRADIPALPTEISKWQKASVELVQLKFRIHSILSGFTVEERQSEHYKELTDILKGIIVHVIDDSHSPDNTPLQGVQIVQNISNVTAPAEPTPKKGKIRNLMGRFWNLQTLIIGIVAAIATAVAPEIPDIIRAIVSIFAGTP